MNRVIAYQLLNAELAAYRGLAYDEVRQLVGERFSRLVRGMDGVDYDLLTTVRWRFGDEVDIGVKAFIGEANWGGPHDEIHDTIVISPPKNSGKRREITRPVVDDKS
jgi:hypothetical protein